MVQNAKTLLSSLHGVGPVLSRGLTKLGLNTSHDLLMYFPRKWDDFSDLVTIAKLHPGNVSIYAKIEKLALKRTIRKRFTIIEAILSDKSGTTKAVWFNQPYLLKTLKEGKYYYFAGNFDFKNNNLALYNSVFSESLEGTKIGRITPVYSESATVSSAQIIKLIAQLSSLFTKIPNILPDYIIKQYDLLDRARAIQTLHQPSGRAELNKAICSIAFEQLFFTMATGLFVRYNLNYQTAQSIKYDQSTMDKFVSGLPFKLTNAQRQVTWQILKDISSNKPMNRLLQGDVGSGKTITALAAIIMSAHSESQTALMAPTAILAAQHFQTITNYTNKSQFKVALLTSAISSADKSKIYEAIVKGKINCVIGTHSLLNEKLLFNNLGLVVIDEQHRFGVAQRLKLKNKAHHTPHLLSMTATPIPRTLALVAYSDLDISILDELPPNRLPIITKVCTQLDRPSIYEAVDQQIADGRQVFVVCGIIDESDDRKSVVAEQKKLQSGIFSHRRIAILHGRMSAQDKDLVMQSFYREEIDILVCTSVIEVGIDMPNASVVMIEDADRFGLAALHQLRGRVGRSIHQGYCYLFSSSFSESAKARLSALARSNDGLRLSQIDLENRGGGDIYGIKQHGKIALSMVDFNDIKLIMQAKEAATGFINEAKMLQYPTTTDTIKSRVKINALD